MDISTVLKFMQIALRWWQTDERRRLDVLWLTDRGIRLRNGSKLFQQIEPPLPNPFKWTANPGKIIAAVKRGHQALDSIH